jgi:2,4-dienoyl-CoA reductase-like NADH-dependent reductase (Old Yellow Enzyme family)
MSNASLRVFSPSIVGSLFLPNRFMRSATCEALCDPKGFPLPKLLTLLENLAKGGCGLVVPGFVYPIESGRATPGQCGLHNDAAAAAWKPLVTAIHKTPSKIIFQVCHAGFKVPPEFRNGEPGKGPSTLLGCEQSLTIPEIEDIVDSFIQCARRVKAIGGDGIQLHAAHGFLLSTFLSPAYNQRNDAYGDDRTLIVSQIVNGIRQTVGPDFHISAKINGHDYVENGVTPELAGQYVAKLTNIDLFEISCGAAPGKVYPVRSSVDPALFRRYLPKESAETIIKNAQAMMEGIPILPNYNLEYTKVIRRIAPKAKLAVVGGIRELAVMEQIVKEGTADLISLSRPFIRQPDICNKLLKGASRCDCITCGLCTMGGRALTCFYPKAK